MIETLIEKPPSFEKHVGLLDSFLLIQTSDGKLVITLDNTRRNGGSVEPQAQSLVAVVEIGASVLTIKGSTTQPLLAPVAIADLGVVLDIHLDKPFYSESGRSGTIGLQPPEVDPKLGLAVPRDFCFAYAFNFAQPSGENN